MSTMRGTGGNRFISGDAGRLELLLAIDRGLGDLQDYAEQTGRRLDLGAITVDTMYSNSGDISVSVTGDLAVGGE